MHTCIHTCIDTLNFFVCKVSMTLSWLRSVNLLTFLYVEFTEGHLVDQDISRIIPNYVMGVNCGVMLT